jgi:hypothetical protein
MMSAVMSVLATLRGVLQSRIALHLEVLALRHRLQVLQQSRPRRIILARADLMALGLVVARLARLLNGIHHREARDRCRVASAWLSAVLDVEEPAAPFLLVC